MTARFAPGIGAAFVYVLATQAAFADLTAQEVWSDWKGYLISTGYTVTGDEQSSDGTLSVSNVSLTMQIPDEEGSARVTMDQMDFVENGDGTVSITMPDSIPIMFDSADSGDDAVSGVMTLTHTDVGMTASGIPEDVTYKYGAARVTMELSSLTTGGEPVPSSVLRLAVAVDNFNSTSRLIKSDLRNFSQQLTADKISYDIAFDDPESDDMGLFKGALQDFSAEGTGAIPLEMDPADFGATLDAGFAMDVAFAFGPNDVHSKMAGNGEELETSATSQSATAAFAIDADNLSMNVGQSQISASIISGEFPVPIEYAAELMKFNLSFPMRKSQEPTDFAFGLDFSGFTMSEMLWSMFDPSAQFPRDPATVIVDTVGKTKVLLDLFNPDEAAMAETAGAPPFELNALTINKLLVSMVGARLDGTGDFTFDNTDLATFDGLPRPTGHVDLKLVGANALLDKLIGMGFVAEQEAMGARMMMGLLAVPGAEPDTLTSKIEINDQGHISANGQRIK